MKCRGKLIAASRELTGRNINLTFSVSPECANQIDNIANQDLDITVDKHREPKSAAANRMLWSCLKEISQVTGRSPWKEYLDALKKYGEFRYVVVKEKAVEEVRRQWRESEIVGEVEIDGQKGIELICFFGSSSYDSKEFSRLLNGVIDDMKDLGIQPPASRDMKRIIERLEHEEKNSREQER